MSATKRYWLVKSEPGTYSIDDLERDASTHWDGIRNFRARNNMRAMKMGDEVLFYHSSANPPAVVGIARVAREAYPDPSQFDKKSKYYDESSSPGDPRWWLVDLAFVARLPNLVSLEDVKGEAALADMELVRYGRLSVQAVKKDELDRIKRMGGMR